MFEQPKWKELTSCQKLALIPVSKEAACSTITTIIQALVSPFGNAEANLTWTLAADDKGFVLKVHAQKDTRPQHG